MNTNNLVGSLQNIKNEIQRKKIFKTVSFSLPSDLPANDLKKVSKDLSKNIITERVKLVKSIESRNNNIQRYMAELRSYKTEKEELEKRLEKFNEKDIEKDITKYFDQILKALPIEHIEFIDPAVTIFTTSIFKKHNKIMGSYRIWIDWNYEDHQHAIRIVNLHHESSSHPHPCVGSGGTICEGNATPTFKKYYEEKDIYNLVESIIGFLLSEDVSHGYITRWDSWFDGLQDVDPKTIFSRRGILPGRI